MTYTSRTWPDDAHRCRVCSQDRAGHDRLNAYMPDDAIHLFEPKGGDRRLPADQIRSVVGELRDHKASERKPND